MGAIEIGILFGGVTLAIGIATFFIGRMTAAKNSGQEQGMMIANIEHIKSDISEIKIMFAKNMETVMATIDQERRERREGDQRLHLKLEEHIKTYHVGGG